MIYGLLHGMGFEREEPRLFELRSEHVNGTQRYAEVRRGTQRYAEVRE